MPFTHYLRQHREARGMLQAELAKKCGTHSSIISRFETGDRGLTFEMAATIARELGTTTDGLQEPFKGQPTLEERLAAVERRLDELAP
jgi:transcriptional regulator with XRE-family HTH domain